MTTTAPVHLTVAQAAERLGVSADTVRRWIHAGELAVFRRGFVIRVPTASIAAFVSRHTTPEKGPPPSRARKPRAVAAARTGARAEVPTPLEELARIRAEREGTG